MGESTTDALAQVIAAYEAKNGQRSMLRKPDRNSENLESRTVKVEWAVEDWMQLGKPVRS